jgi:hypothetical protein
MALDMKISNAKVAAKLMYVLFRFKVISDKTYHSAIDYLTVKSLKYQMKEYGDDKFSDDK